MTRIGRLFTVPERFLAPFSRVLAKPWRFRYALPRPQTDPEGSHSGLVHSLGKRAYRKVSEVRILSPPPQKNPDHRDFSYSLRSLVRPFNESATLRTPPMTKNIGTPDRLLRLAFAILLAIAAYRAESLPWQLILLAGALFCLFQALTSWCVLYALLGKSTCPIQKPPQKS